MLSKNYLQKSAIKAMKRITQTRSFRESFTDGASAQT
jgi:hypothetical protein